MTDMQTSLPLLIVRPSILNTVINFSTHLWPVKWNALSYTFVMRIPFHLLQCRCNTCTNTINNDMINSISSYDHIGLSILTSFALHRCFGPSALSHHSTCPSHLQPVRLAKSCLNLLHLDHMTQCHVSCNGNGDPDLPSGGGNYRCGGEWHTDPTSDRKIEPCNLSTIAPLVINRVSD